MTRQVESTDGVLDYYRQETAYSTAGTFASHYDGLPDDIASLCAVLHGTILHMFWISEKTYGITYEKLKAVGRKLCVEFSYESAEQRLRNIIELDDQPLLEARDSMHRSVGCCRDYALMLASILRHKGVPARVRTGAALYFRTPEGSLIEDHYVTEHWNAVETRWQLTDPQIGDVQRPTIEKGVDPIDLAEGVFLTGWQLVEALRNGDVKPESVGFPPVNAGLTYGRNKLFADFVGVTGHELPVHAWGGSASRRASNPGMRYSWIG